MGNNGNNGQNHWSHPSNVLRDSEKIRTQPMPKPQPTTQEDLPTHIDGSLFKKEVPLGKGFSVTGEGPNFGLGAKKTEDGVKLDSQLNLGGVSLKHTNDDHEISGGLSYGWGFGGELHGGEKPGVSFSGGPFTGTYRSKSLNKPASQETHDFMEKF